MAKTKVRFVEGADVALADFMEFLGDCLLDGVVASDDETSLTITGADTLGTLTGENISLGLASTGTISTWVLEENGEKLWTISNAGFDVAALTAAAFAEGYGEDVFAFETYYFDRDWNYRGTDADDLAPPGATTSDGFEIDFVGDDVFTLRGGASAATAAPALTPSRPGSASGLRITVCAMVPASPSAAPASAASAARGRRRSSTIIAEAGEVVRSPVRAPRISAAGRARSPSAREAAKTAASDSARVSPGAMARKGAQAGASAEASVGAGAWVSSRRLMPPRPPVARPGRGRTR